MDAKISYKIEWQDDCQEYPESWCLVRYVIAKGGALIISDAVASFTDNEEAIHFQRFLYDNGSIEIADDIRLLFDKRKETK
ncbi:hypothetical protein LCGC14_0630750 [marine sediment metagenome]|uniref:Uncharacterized protein n=1 Tax=marine sediment metagenome TaxID=412755 RepID=A0A0F9UAJ7_9ZZZZ